MNTSRYPSGISPFGSILSSEKSFCAFDSKFSNSCRSSGRWNLFAQNIITDKHDFCSRIPCYFHRNFLLLLDSLEFWYLFQQFLFRKDCFCPGFPPFWLYPGISVNKICPGVPVNEMALVNWVIAWQLDNLVNNECFDNKMPALVDGQAVWVNLAGWIFWIIWVIWASLVVWVIQFSWIIWISCVIWASWVIWISWVF